MRRISVKCPGYRKPARVFDLLMDDSENIFVEIKFPGCPDAARIKINDYLLQLHSLPNKYIE